MRNVLLPFVAVGNGAPRAVPETLEANFLYCDVSRISFRVYSNQITILISEYPLTDFPASFSVCAALLRRLFLFALQSTSALSLSLDALGGSTAPLKNYDPLRLANIGSDETLMWFRAAELKHSRCAMIAFTGYWINSQGLHFPGMLSTSENISFEDLSSMTPPDAWAAVPDAGKAQIIGTIFVAELYTESQGTHYTKGGKLPEVVFPKFDFSKVDPAVLETKRCRELNNGRLAMFGIMGFLAAHNIPGSVPFLADKIM